MLSKLENELLFKGKVFTENYIWDGDERIMDFVSVLKTLEILGIVTPDLLIAYLDEVKIAWQIQSYYVTYIRVIFFNEDKELSKILLNRIKRLLNFIYGKKY